MVTFNIFLFTILFSLLFFLFTIQDSPDALTSADISYIIILLLAVSVLFEIAIRLLKTFTKNRFKILQTLARCGFIFVMVYSLNLGLSEEFFEFRMGYRLGIYGIICFIIFTAINFIQENKTKGGYLNAALVFAMIILGLSEVVSNRSEVDSVAVKLDYTNFSLTPEEVNFRVKPNVYMISFDSLQPISLVEKHLGFSNTAYHEILDSHFRKLPNFFADRVPTRYSLNSLLALDIDWFDHLINSGSSIENFKFYSGRKPSPLLQIFKNNGYSTNTLFNGKYFGIKKGPYVDFYHRNIEEGSCNFLTENKKKALLLGYCYLREVRERYFLMAEGQSENAREQDNDSVTFLINQMNAGLTLGKPQIFFAYIFLPGHTQLDLVYGDTQALEIYKEGYPASSEKTAAALMQLIKFIDEKDKNAILYVFGDHGSWITRGPIKEGFETDSELFIHDRHGAFGGLYPPTRCNNFDELTEKSKFITASNAAIEIINCLSKEKLIYKKPDLVIPESYYGREVDFHDFIYE